MKVKDMELQELTGNVNATMTTKVVTVHTRHLVKIELCTQTSNTLQLEPNGSTSLRTPPPIRTGP